MALVHLSSRPASDLDESSHPSAVFPKSYLPSGTTRAGLEHLNDPYETTWITSEFDLHTWQGALVDDWRAVIAPYVFPTLGSFNICSRCRTFDLGTYFDQADQTSTSLEFVPDMSRMDADCGFCSILTAVSRDSDGREFWVVNPSTGTFQEFYLQKPRGTGWETFMLWAKAYQLESFSLAWIRWPETPAVVNFEVLKEYLTHCICEHGNVCGVGQAAPVDKLLVLIAPLV